MAFKAEKFTPFPASRGTGGYFTYSDQGHTLSNMKAANFFNTAGTRDQDQASDAKLVGGFIAAQRDPEGTVANNPVLGHLVGSDATEIAAFVLNDATGAVVLKTTPGPATGWIID